VPKRPVGVLLAVAHGQIAVTPAATRAEAFRHVGLVRVGRIGAGNRGRKNKRRSTTQYGGALAGELEFHFDSFETVNQYSRFQAIFRRAYDAADLLCGFPRKTHSNRLTSPNVLPW
jgi:hypothetical protein